MPKRESPAEGFEVELPSDGQQPDDVRDFIVEHCWGDVGPIRVIANDANPENPNATESCVRRPRPRSTFVVLWRRLLSALRMA